jgi:hypothetical protein
VELGLEVGTSGWPFRSRKKAQRRRSIPKRVKGESFGALFRSYCVIVSSHSLRNIAYSYEVHEKLQNFMVPVPAHTSWHEEQIDELFTSLSGKGLENAGMLDSESEVAEMNVEEEGFRVFG